MPDLLKISITFLFILFLLRKKLNIGYVMLIASVVLALLYRMDSPLLLKTLKSASLSEITLKLLLSLSLIRIFELMLRERNVLSDMMSSVKGFFKSRKAVIVSMPLLIGMLPSLGGAYFSAPMVKDATAGLKMSPEEKAFINYWFRHPWECMLPLYPGILLASAISKIPLHTMIATNLSYGAIIFATGFLYSMRGAEKKSLESRGEEKTIEKGKAARTFIPLVSILLLVAVFRMELQYALLLIIFILFLIYRNPLRDIPRLLKYGFARDVILLIFGIMLFKETLEISGAVHNLSLFFLEQGIPIIPVLCFLPFLVGLLTGLTVGFVGSTFPLLMSISGGASVANISFAFASGYIGVLLSPVHLCLVLTREYFKADLWGIYKKIAPSCGFIFLTAMIEYMLLR